MNVNFFGQIRFIWKENVIVIRTTKSDVIDKYLRYLVPVF